MNQSAGDSVDKKLVVYLELDGVLERLVVGFQHVIQTVCLCNGSWEAVKDESSHVSHCTML